MQVLRLFFDVFTYGVSAEKKYQIDKKFFFQITNVLNQITNFTSFLLKNIFLKKISIWYFFPALTPYVQNSKYIYIFLISNINKKFVTDLIHAILVLSESSCLYLHARKESVSIR